MGKYDDDFFEGKRPWSIIKDQVLASYMPPYIRKVNKLGKPILFIDGYAGPGKFDDGKPGSPLIISNAAKKHATQCYEAHFYNIDKNYHIKLDSILKKGGWYPASQAHLGDSLREIKKIPEILSDQTVFLYLDPFGLKGCGFDILKPFLSRNQAYSTEILLTMNMPGVPRLAARHAVENGRQDEKTIKANHEMLTNVFGGEYWQDIMWKKDSTDEERLTALMDAYLNKLKQYLPFTGSCPVRLKTDKRIKYFIVFASRSSEAMVLLNNIMVNAYFSNMHKAEYANTLFEDFHWREMPDTTRSLKDLDSIILSLVNQYPGESRNSIWLRLIKMHFMRYHSGEFIEAIKKLNANKKIRYDNPRNTNKLNDDCLLYPLN